MKRSPGAIPLLSERWPQVSKRIRKKRRVLVFLDFDGTLAAIAKRPDRVVVRPAMRRTLRQLARHKRATVAVISGRRRAELQRYLAIPKLHHLGLYGWERNGKEKIPASARVVLFRAHVLLLTELSGYPGVWIEPKRNSFSVHLMNAKPSAQRRARTAVRGMLRRFGNSLQLFENLRDMEVMPARLPDKGAAVRELLGRRNFRGALAFFFGDDLSDEPAFAAVRDGVSVLVGKPRKTRARFRLRNPQEVAVALKRLEEELT
jgi:trehalose 6-phosphate phosphatase